MTGIFLILFPPQHDYDRCSLPAVLRWTEIRRGIFIIIGNKGFPWCTDAIDAMMVFLSQGDVQRAKAIYEMFRCSPASNA